MVQIVPVPGHCLPDKSQAATFKFFSDSYCSHLDV